MAQKRDKGQSRESLVEQVENLRQVLKHCSSGERQAIEVRIHQLERRIAEMEQQTGEGPTASSVVLNFYPAESRQAAG